MQIKITLFDSVKKLSCNQWNATLQSLMYLSTLSWCKCVRSENCLLVEETPLLRINWLIVSAYTYYTIRLEWIQMQDCNRYNGEGFSQKILQNIFVFHKIGTYISIHFVYILLNNLALCCLNWYITKKLSKSVNWIVGLTARIKIEGP